MNGVPEEVKAAGGSDFLPIVESSEIIFYSRQIVIDSDV